MENQEMTPASSVSLGTRIMNVFASPAEAFEGIGSSGSKASFWVIPLVVTIIVGLVSTYVLFSSETLRSQVMEQQTKAMEKRVQEGKMTQEQFDQAQSGMEKMGGMMMGIGMIGVVIVVGVYFFGIALVLWLTGKFGLKAQAGYSAYLSLLGLASWIGVLGGIITMLMIVGLNSFYATPSAALAIYSSYDVTDTTHRILSKINLFTFWQTALVGIGLGKLAGKPAGVGIGVAFGLLAAWFAISIPLGLG